MDSGILCSKGRDNLGLSSVIMERGEEREEKGGRVERGWRNMGLS
jgi:hypothetical protein